MQVTTTLNLDLDRFDIQDAVWLIVRRDEPKSYKLRGNG